MYGGSESERFFYRMNAGPSPRTAYVSALLAPILGLALLNAAESAQWLGAGTCPAGPMDRPAAPCGLVDFVMIVVLGGWAAFVVVPLLCLWWLAATAVFLVIVRRRRRARGELAKGGARK